ncbi:MAG: hypothetical protein ABL901_00165 [Hyphomicrobiaceae bacterium]
MTPHDETLGTETMPRTLSVTLMVLNATAVLLGSLAAGVALTSMAAAEPVLDRALSGLRAANSKGCEIVKIDFNFRISYQSHFPVDQGSELRITIQPVDRAQAAAFALLKREALRAPDNQPTSIASIEFEAAAQGGPVLRIQFKSPVSYRVGPGADFESMIVAIAGNTASPNCKPIFPYDSADAWNTKVSGGPLAPIVAVPSPALGTPTTNQQRQAAAWMDEARAAIKKSNFEIAIRILTKVIELPRHADTAAAQELLGVAYQKSGQNSQARVVYEDYLTRHSTGEDGDRVRQRLAGIITAEGGNSSKLRSSNTGSTGKVPNGSTWSISGSASAFYYRDDSFRSLRDPSLPPEVNGAKDDHQVHRNVLLSSFDVVAAWSDPAIKSKFRFSGTQEHSLTSTNFGDDDIIAVASLNLETMIREWDVTTRIGRQTRNTGGVLGRFDGALASWQVNPAVRLNAVVGSPVQRRKDEPFKDEKLFYGASVDFGAFWGVETSLFAIEQRDRSFLDRQAIGAEFRYLQPDKSVLASFDYDVHFATLNAAVINGTWTLADKSTFHGSLDYRKAPYLSATTALQGQPFVTLYDLLKVKTKDEVDQLALDRSATYQAASLGFSRPINDHLQVSVDGTVASISGTISSGGVDATLSPGTDYYASAQLIGTDLYTTGDMYIAGIRYANRADSNLYVADFSARYPVTNDLRVSPRVAFAYQDGNTTNFQEFSVLPSVLFNYALTRDLNFEMEAGTKWTQRQQDASKENQTDFFFTLGVRYDFSADGRVTCAYASPVCKK